MQHPARFSQTSKQAHYLLHRTTDKSSLHRLGDAAEVDREDKSAQDEAAGRAAPFPKPFRTG
jgi:hypothetical protein